MLLYDAFHLLKCGGLHTFDIPGINKFCTFPKNTQVGVRREGTMALRNCCKNRDEKPMQMKILNELEDLEEEDEEEEDEND